ncbi:MAG: hypothetical protein GY803_06725, partial [Chloroflexi bacterium]|nr:hypothetical protein [Chloroflexota bacterium]
MGYQYDDEQGGQSSGTNWILWAAIGALVLFLIGACLVGGFLLAQQFQRRTVPPTPLIVPTSPMVTDVVEPTDFPLAPTATLRQPGEATAVPVGAGNVEAGQLPNPPTIDGDLSEWAGAATVESAFRVYNHSSWDGTDDVTAVWSLAWDADNLYFAARVTDDAHVQTQTGNQIFRGDSVDMQLDMDRNGDYGATVSPDDFQIIYSPGDFASLPPSAFRFQGATGSQMRDAAGHSIRLAAQPTDLGYNLEAAVPWRDLNVTPSSGMVIGLALNVSDNDGVGTAVQEVMKSHVSTRQYANPASWGTLTLK